MLYIWISRSSNRTDFLSSSPQALSLPLFSVEVTIYAPTSNSEEAEVEWFYEDLQDLLELTPQKLPGKPLIIYVKI